MAERLAAQINKATAAAAAQQRAVDAVGAANDNAAGGFSRMGAAAGLVPATPRAPSMSRQAHPRLACAEGGYSFLSGSHNQPEPNLMLSSLEIKFSENSHSLKLDTSSATILVGPNSSGKSLLLKELEDAIFYYKDSKNYHIFKDLSIKRVKGDIVRDIIDRAAKGQDQAEKEESGQILVAGRRRGAKFQYYINPDFILSLVDADVTRWNANRFIFANQILRLTTLRLDGRSRFELVEDQKFGDLLSEELEPFVAIFNDDKLRKEIREMIFDGIGLYFVLDPTKGGSLRIRLSSEAPLNDEQSLNAAAREYHKKSQYILEASDGFQAYTGIILSIVEGLDQIILIDEPEAFLHPPLAKKLGSQIAEISSKRKASLIIATHSADFLIGCLQASSNINILRMEYRNGKSRGRLVPSSELQQLYRHPLMRSANVISGLFYDGVVVTESDNDRVFYSEIYHRLIASEQSPPNILFVNAQNKQTAKEIVSPLRRFGVPAAVILDIDLVKDGGREWTNLLQAAQMPELSRQPNSNQREAIKKALEATLKNMKTDGGINLLSPGDRKSANQFFDYLDKYGIFVVRFGELEDWLPSLAAVGKKTEWLLSMMEKLGSNSADPSYVRPAEGDVWDFMRGVIAWIADPARDGTD